MTYKAKIKDMRILEDVIQERIAKNPALERDIAEARASLEVAILEKLTRASHDTAQNRPPDASVSIPS